MSKENKNDFGEETINRLFPSEDLSVFFEKRINELNITPTNALEIIDIEYRSLQGILKGTNKRVDYTNFIKLANFLKISKEKVFDLYLKALEKNFPIDSNPFPQNKIDFINKNFDLVTLKKAKFIENITNYEQIEKRINERFGFKTIFEYKLPSDEIAFSAGLIKPKNPLTRGIWINEAETAFVEINNPYEYNREGLIKYFPEIRWHSTNVEQGLLYVIKALYKLGITVIYQTSFESLHLRGATMKINNKPCIVLTDYRGFYSTLFFALCHELSHVLFDLDELKHVHVSEDEPHDLIESEKENEANNFSREYLFSKDKLKEVKAHLNNSGFIKTFAELNQVHESFIYTFHAFDSKKDDRNAWARARRHNPPFEKLIEQIKNPWENGGKSIENHIRFLREECNLYN